MNTIHIIDEMLQLVAIEGIEKHPSVKEHLSQCSSCKAQVNFYKLLIEKIEITTPATFKFDLTNLVLEKLPEPLKPNPVYRKSALSRFLLIPIFFGAILLIYIFRKELLQLSKTSNEITLFTIAISGLSLLSFATWDMFREYENKMKELNHQ